MPEGSVRTSNTFTCDVCAGVKHIDTGDCAASFFEKCAANTYKGGYDKHGCPPLDLSDTDKPNWRMCAVCWSTWCTYCTPDRLFRGCFKCPECVNSSR